jgi:hypothetical protein
MLLKRFYSCAFFLLLSRHLCFKMIIFGGLCRTAIECGSLCSANDGCSAFAFDKAARICNLGSKENATVPSTQANTNGSAIKLFAKLGIADTTSTVRTTNSTTGATARTPDAGF